VASTGASGAEERTLKSSQFDPTSVEMQPYPLPADRLSGGAEVMFSVQWQRDDGSEVRGVWEMTPGVLHATEGDEMFVVVSGRATVEFQDGRTWQLAPGDVGVTVPGDVAEWVVHETLRKVFHRRMG
jgi:uncharacterized cupin superfamily protein